MTVKANPKMVELARHARGLTQGELATQLNFTQATLSRVERGLTPIDDAVLSELSKALHYPETFFFQDGGIHTAKMKYTRARRGASVKLLHQLDAENNIRARVMRELFRPFEFEHYDIPDLPVNPVYGSPAQVAKALREQWTLPRGPIDDLTLLLEGAGLFIIYTDFLGSDKIDGITYQFPVDYPDIIFINKNKPADRIRYTLAHELGHKVMHSIPVGSGQAESEANAFASEFMMPENEIRPYLYKLSLNTLVDLKLYWKMSMAAILYRAKVLKTIAPRQHKYLRFKIREVSDGRQEPSETALPHERPRMITQMIELHKKHLDYTTADLAEALRLYEDDYRRMFDPPPPRAKIYQLPNVA